MSEWVEATESERGLGDILSFIGWKKGDKPAKPVLDTEGNPVKPHVDESGDSHVPTLVNEAGETVHEGKEGIVVKISSAFSEGVASITNFVKKPAAEAEHGKKDKKDKKEKKDKHGEEEEPKKEKKEKKDKHEEEEPKKEKKDKKKDKHEEEEPKKDKKEKKEKK